MRKSNFSQRSFYSRLNRLSLLLPSFLLISCQTAPLKEFENVGLGHDKADVLEAVGGPSWKDRRQGMDRWTYIIYQDGVRLERQILFADGIVAYKGEPIPPFITAEEQDEINSQLNLSLEKIENRLPPPVINSTFKKQTGQSSQ